MEKLRIKVKSVSPREEFQGRNGPVKVLKFQGVISNGEEIEGPYTFSIYDTAFDEHIKPDNIFEADVDVQTKGDFTNRTIKQIYIGGQPVKQPRPQGGGYRGKSPEETRSIERQCCAKIAYEHPVLNQQGQINDAATLKRAEQIYQWVSTK